MSMENFLQFSNPSSGWELADAAADAGPPPPPRPEPVAIGGIHYHTWRNIMAREALKEKEAHEGGERAYKYNPEPIPETVFTQKAVTQLLDVPARYQDQNFIQVVQPLQMFRPRTLMGEVDSTDKTHKEYGLKEIVRFANAGGWKVKAVGTGHSFSDIMTTPDFLVVTDGLNKMLTYPKVDATDTTMMELNIAHYPLLKKEIREAGYAKFVGHAEDDPYHKPALVEFEAGIKLDALNDILWNRGWSLANLGTYQGQSFIGAVSTSTHGSGHRLEPLPDLIQSLVIVASDGMAYRIEPSNGITDTEGLSPVRSAGDGKGLGNHEISGKFRAQGDPGVDFLIQNDDVFNSALVNVGTFGLVYSVIVRVVPRFFLLETNEITIWEHLKERLLQQHKLMFRDSLTADELEKTQGAKHEIFEYKTFDAKGMECTHPHEDLCIEANGEGGLRVSNIRQASILVNYNAYMGAHFCRITRQYELPYDVVQENGWETEKVKKDEGRKLKPSEKKTLQSILDYLGETLRYDPSQQDRLYTKKQQLILSSVIFPPSQKEKSKAESIHATMDTLVEIHDNPLTDRTATKAKKAPIEPETEDYYFNRGYRVYLKPSDLNGYGIETGFAIRKDEAGPELSQREAPNYIAAIDRSLAIAKTHWEQGRYIQTATTAVRFVKGSRAYLSPQYGDLTCMIEMLNVADTHGGKELFYRYQKAFQEMEGRPHWGLDLSVTTGNNHFLEHTYPKFPIWKQVYDIMNAHGTFDNRFTDRMGLSLQAYKR